MNMMMAVNDIQLKTHHDLTHVLITIYQVVL